MGYDRQSPESLPSLFKPPKRAPLKVFGHLLEPVYPCFGLAGLFLPQAQLIAQSIGQAFSVAYQEFLRANGINPEDLSQKEYSDIINTQEMYNDDLIHFSNSENCKEVSHIGWGSPGGEPHRPGASRR